MSTYTITTDAAAMTVEANTADEAAAIFAGRKGKGGPATLAELAARVEEAGGWLIVAEDGEQILRVGR